MSQTLFKRVVISNAFSTNMLAKSEIVAFVKIDVKLARMIVRKAKELGIEITSIVGHESTAKLLSKLLDHEVKVNRVEYRFSGEDMLLIFTVPVRLPEGKVLTDEEIKEFEDKIQVYAAFNATEQISGFITLAFMYLLKMVGAL